MKVGISGGMARREFLMVCVAAATAVTTNRVSADSAAPGHATSDGSHPSGNSAAGPAQWVNPFIGTGWHGHTFPGATAPFGLVQLSPDTSGPTEAQEKERGKPNDPYQWDHCSGYFYTDNVIKGFTHTHLSGTGVPDLGDILLMPMVEGRNWGWDPLVPGQQHEAQLAALGPNSGWISRGGTRGYCSTFSHHRETAHAGYYSVYLQTPQVKAELTATTRCAMHRYTYPVLPEETQRALILDLVHGLGSTVYQAELNIESPTRISGYRYSHGFIPDAQVYFVMEFSKPITRLDVKAEERVHTNLPLQRRKISGVKIKAMLHHAADSDPLVVRVGISCTGIDGARKNLAAEIPHWHFDVIHRQAERHWNKTLGVLDAKLPDRDLTQTFYTAAYHGSIAPVTFDDVDGTYSGLDRKNHANPGFTNYTSMSIWDIFRCEFPFIMLTQPHRTNAMINSLLVGYRQLNQHTLPLLPYFGNETNSMTGFHVVAMITGAYARGFRGYDVEAAYAAMRDTAMVGAAGNGNRELQKEFRRLGYIPDPHGTGYAQSVSVTLGFCYDYWCVGAMAEMLGKHVDARLFYRLAQNYKNLFDPQVGFMRGKTKEGQWRKPFRPDEEYWSDYTESDAWEATFNVMQDVQGLIDLFGGDKPFITQLDRLFTAPSRVHNYDGDITGMVGQDAQGNEPSNHIPYLYTFAGAAWKTQYWVRKVLGLYKNTPAGLPGNDDCGQTSSCFTLGALGFYPVNPATGVYVIGSPLVDRVRIHNPARRTTFTIIAENNSPENCYIQSAALNGTELTRSWLTHAQITADGELHFRMGSKPNKEWASAKADRPPSGLIKM